MGLETAPAAEWTRAAGADDRPGRPKASPTSGTFASAIKTWSEMVRERGYDPDDQLAEIAAFNDKLDKAKVTLDCDPRKTSQQGQPTVPSSNGHKPDAVPAAAKGG